MKELTELTENQRNDLDDLLTDDYDEESEDWMESLISSECDDAESETENEEDSIEGRKEDANDDKGLSIDDPEEAFFEMDLNPTEKPASKPMDVQTTKVPPKITKKITPHKRRILLTAKNTSAIKSPKSMHASFSKPNVIHHRQALKQEPEKKEKTEKPKKYVKVRPTVKKEKSLWKESGKDEKKQTGFVWQKTNESTQRKEDHMNPKKAKPESMQTAMMDFHKNKKSTCLSDRFCQVPSQIGMTVNESRRKRPDLMGL